MSSKFDCSSNFQFQKAERQHMTLLALITQYLNSHRQDPSDVDESNTYPREEVGRPCYLSILSTLAQGAFPNQGPRRQYSRVPQNPIQKFVSIK